MMKFKHRSGRFWGVVIKTADETITGRLMVKVTGTVAGDHHKKDDVVLVKPEHVTLTEDSA